MIVCKAARRDLLEDMNKAQGLYDAHLKGGEVGP
jgi:hypothetical protein